EDRPARREHDEQREEHRQQPVEPEDRPVHSGCLALLDTISSSATSTKFARIDEPPYEMKGSVTPVSGMTRVTPPTITKTCRAKTAASPLASSLENESRAIIAVLKPRSTMSR